MNVFEQSLGILVGLLDCLEDRTRFSPLSKEFSIRVCLVPQEQSKALFVIDHVLFEPSLVI